MSTSFLLSFLNGPDGQLGIYFGFVDVQGAFRGSSRVSSVHAGGKSLVLIVGVEN